MLLAARRPEESPGRRGMVSGALGCEPRLVWTADGGGNPATFQSTAERIAPSKAKRRPALAALEEDVSFLAMLGDVEPLHFLLLGDAEPHGGVEDF